MIIDAHAHVARVLTGFWQPLRYGKTLDQGQERQTLPPSFDPSASPPEVLLGYMDQAGVDRAILVQHHLYGNQNETVLECVRRWPDRFSGYAYLGALDAPDAPDQLERLIESGIIGLKVEVASTRRLRADFSFTGEREWRVWERLSQLKRPLALDLITSNPEDTPALRRVLDELPGIQLVLCHIGGVPGNRWQERALLAREPRVWLDLAALPLLTRPLEEYPWPGTQELIRWTVEQVGAERVLWGTDYPPALNRGTYQQLLDVARLHCDFLTPEQRAGVLSGNAERFLSGLGR